MAKGGIGIYGNLINQRGLVSADRAAVGANGQIVFKASGDLLLEAGSLTAEPRRWHRRHDPSIG